MDSYKHRVVVARGWRGRFGSHCSMYREFQ